MSSESTGGKEKNGADAFENVYVRIGRSQENANHALHVFLESLPPPQRATWVLQIFQRLIAANGDLHLFPKEQFAANLPVELIQELKAQFFCFFSEENREISERAVDLLRDEERAQFWKLYEKIVLETTLEEHFRYDPTHAVSVLPPGIANYFTVWYLDQQFRDLRSNLERLRVSDQDVSLLVLMRLTGYFDKKHPYYVYAMSNVAPHVAHIIEDTPDTELLAYVASLAKVEVSSAQKRLDALRRYWPNALLPTQRTYAAVNKISLALAENRYNHLERSSSHVPVLPGTGNRSDQIFITTFQESASKHVIHKAPANASEEEKAREAQRLAEMNYDALSDADAAAQAETHALGQRQVLLSQKSKQSAMEWRRVVDLYRSEKLANEPFAAIVSSEEFKLLVHTLQKHTTGKTFTAINWEAFLADYKRSVGDRRWEQVARFFGKQFWAVSYLERSALLIYTAAQAHLARSAEHKIFTGIIHTVLAPALEAYTPPSQFQPPPKNIEEDILSRYSFPVQLQSMKAAMGRLKVDDGVESIDSSSLREEMNRRIAMLSVLFEKVDVPRWKSSLSTSVDAAALVLLFSTSLALFLEFFYNLQSSELSQITSLVPIILLTLGTISVKVPLVPDKVREGIQSSLRNIETVSNDFYEEFGKIENQIEGTENKRLARKQVNDIVFMFTVIGILTAGSQLGRLDQVRDALRRIPPPATDVGPVETWQPTPTLEPSPSLQPERELRSTSVREYPPLNGEFETFVEIWSIEGPVPEGYFRDSTTEVFTSHSTWRNELLLLSSPVPNSSPLPGQTMLVSRAAAQGEAFKVPIPPGYMVNYAATFSGEELEIRHYSDGTYRVLSRTGRINDRLRLGLVPTSIRDTEPPLPHHLEHRMLLGEVSLLPTDLQNLIQSLASSGLSNQEKAERARTYIHSHLHYSLDPRYNSYYLESADQPGGFLRGVLRAGAGDCDVANTAFIAILRAIGVPARMAFGYANGLFDQQLTVLSSQEGHGWVQIWTGTEWIDFDGTPGNMDVFSQEVFARAQNVGVGQPMQEQFAVFDEDIDPKLLIASLGVSAGAAALYGIRRVSRKRKARRHGTVSKEFRQIDYALHLDSDTLRACQTFMLFLLNDFAGKSTVTESGERTAVFPMGWKSRDEMLNALTNSILDSVQRNVESGKSARTSLQAREDISTYFSTLANPDFTWSTSHLRKDETYYANVVQGYEFLGEVIERKMKERFQPKTPAYFKCQQLLQFIDSLTE